MSESMNQKVTSLKLTDMEQDLILACKLWYGDNGIDKVIAHYCNYPIELVEVRNRYYWISQLFIKLIDAGHFKFSYFLSELASVNDWFAQDINNAYDIPKYILKKMVSLINCELQVNEHDEQGNLYPLIELHEAQEMFREKKDE